MAEEQTYYVAGAVSVSLKRTEGQGSVDPTWHLWFALADHSPEWRLLDLEDDLDHIVDREDSEWVTATVEERLSLRYELTELSAGDSVAEWGLTER